MLTRMTTVLLVLLAAVTLSQAAEKARPVSLVAVQMQVRLEDYESPDAFRAAVQRSLDAAPRAPAGTPQLIVFPEDVGLPLVLIDDYDAVKGAATWKEAATILIGKHQAEVEAMATKYRCSPIRALFLARGERVRTLYTEVFAQAAVQRQATIVAGSAPLPDGKGNVFNTSYVFGPTGKLLGSQSKVHLIELEGPTGLDLSAAPLTALRALDTPAGRLGVGICYDLFFSDVVERLVADGSRLLIQPTFNPQPWTLEQAEDWKLGLRSAVASHPSVIAGVNPMMVASLFDITAEGVSSIIAAPFTPPTNGYLAQASSPTKEELISATVKLPRK